LDEHQDQKQNSFMTSEGSENNSIKIKKLEHNTTGEVRAYDLSILGSILSQITLQEWRQSTLNLVQFKKSELVDSLDIDDNMLEAMSRMQAQGINLMVFVSKDRTRMHGCL
jgi:hypothetical protein